MSQENAVRRKKAFIETYGCQMTISDHAEQRVFGRVGELYRLKRDRPDLVIGVTGCMAQRLGPALLEKAPYVELVMGPDAYRQLPQVLGKLRPVDATSTSPARRTL